MFRISPGPSSGGITVFHPAHQTASYTVYQSTKCGINTDISPDDGPGEVRNM